ncbi:MULTISPECIES: MFS transporter [unclassified Sinorhizobium]|uniref:MFS transporter n=1 Tax=unclassified Sinorhizobium TaxID=2613772 RepID=UPI003524F013
MNAIFASGKTEASVRRVQVQWAKRVRLAAAFLLMMVSGLVWNSFGLFLVALEAEFHWPRAAISGAYGAFALINAITAPFFGYLLGRYDSRPLLAAAALLLAIAYGLTATVNSIEQFWLMFGILAGLGTHCTSSYAIFTVLAGRFRRRPATAMAIADAGSGLAAFLGLPLLHLLIENFGWRSAYLAIGVTIAVIGIPLHLFMMDRIKGTRDAPAPKFASGPSFYLLAALIISYFCGSAVYHGLLTQQIALFDELNIGEDKAVWLAAIAGLVVFMWRLASGWICDAWGPGRTMLIAAVGAIFTFLTLLLVIGPDNEAMLFVYPLVLGVAFGGQQVLLANGARLIVSLTALAGVLGICRFASGAGMASGPLIASSLYDLTGGYALAVCALAVLGLAHFISFAVATTRKR